MKKVWALIYNIFVYPLIFILGVFLTPFNKKLREGTLGRFHSTNILRNCTANIKNKSIYWFHAASHGEYEQARPILSGLKEIRRNTFIIASFFSPSGYNNIADENIDCKIYMPFDFIWSIKKVFKVVKPKKIIFASYDLWPNLIWLAKKYNIHTCVFAARFDNESSKNLPILKHFYGSIYQSFATIYTITEEDKAHLNKILKQDTKPIIRVLGNPRFDQVKNKSDKFTKDHTITVMTREKRLIVGSVWPDDERNIINPIFRLLEEDPELKVLWVPHEPSDKYIQAAIQLFEEQGLKPRIVKAKNDSNFHNSRISILGVVGILSNYYWQGQIAYIGGGFSTGVHNVMEPAIARLPVIFGPKYKKSHEAVELIKSGGGFAINNGTEFYEILKVLLTDKNKFYNASIAATKVIHDNIGSATRVVRGIIRD